MDSSGAFSFYFATDRGTSMVSIVPSRGVIQETAGEADGLMLKNLTIF
jgi:hypothetical protein